jgi:hypothetical protein
MVRFKPPQPIIQSSEGLTFSMTASRPDAMWCCATLNNMAYQINQDGEILVSGFENGIGESPYKGLTDMRNINVSSVSGEVCVNFATQSKTPAVITNATITGATDNGGSSVYAGAGLGAIENGQAIVFSVLSSGTMGLVTGTPYWVSNKSGSAFTLTTDYERTSNVTFAGASITGTFSTYNIVTPKYIVQQGNTQDYTARTVYYFMVDSQGYVWSNRQTTTSGAWTFTGNTGLSNGRDGSGLVFYQTSDTAIGYLFVFRGSGIDYTRCDASVISWKYGWNPTTGTTGTAGSSPVLKSSISAGNSHEAQVMPDGRVYFCDGPNVGKFFQTIVTGTNPTALDPGNLSTYTYTSYPLLPLNDPAQCLAPSGTNILIGGGTNNVYSWDTTSTLINFSYQLAETNIVKMVTANTNTYIFAGSRGRIYISNGAQAQLFKKFPDHLTGIIEPYYTWGGIAILKNQLYFGVSATNNAGTRTPLVGGVWAVDMDTKSLRMANQLSHGTYQGNATALFGQGNPSAFALGVGYVTSNPVGSGIIVGWDNVFYGSNSGIDTSIGTLYTGGQSYVVSDMLPVGTYLEPMTPAQVEFKLAVPLLAGEKIELQVANALASGTYPTFTSALITNGDGVLVSGNSQAFPIEKIQWLMIKAILTGGTSATPSFNRLTELRVFGATKGRSSQMAFGPQ